MIRALNKLPDTLGFICGFPLGFLTGSLSFIRDSRMFHPCGIVIKCKVKSTDEIQFPEEAIMRFSSAWWKHKEWRDVLGVAIRFGEIQDLLFASFKHPWQTPFGPFLTKYHDFFWNDYFAVSPFHVKGKKVYFKLMAEDFKDEKGSRDQKLRDNIGHAKFLLMMGHYKEWHPIAEITLLEESDINQQELKFNPFLNGVGIYPKGFIQYLRIGSYRFSQLGRMIRHNFKKVPYHINNRRIIHGL
jgi:hypothetical protein